MIGTMTGALDAETKVRSLGLSGRAHVVAVLLLLGGAVFLLRLLRRRAMRGKYTLLWMFVGLGVLVLAAWPSIVDRTSRWLNIYDPPNTLFLAAIAFLLLVCVYFSYELSRLEERTRILAEELAILRSESVDAGKAAGEADRA